MDPFIGGALIGGASSIFSNVLGAHNSGKQMEFQERMSNTAYQRGVKDMMKAGLNPMLAYSQGGASTPIGSMPQVQDIGQGAAAGAGAVGAAKAAKANIENIEAQTAKTKSETFSNLVNLQNKEASTELLLQQAGLTDWQAREIQGLLGPKRANLEWDSIVKKAQHHARMGDHPDYKGTAYQAKADEEKIEALMKKYDLKRAEAEAKFYGSDLGGNAPAISFIRDMLKSIMSGRR